MLRIWSTTGPGCVLVHDLRTVGACCQTEIPLPTSPARGLRGSTYESLLALFNERVLCKPFSV